jgi:pimeloyl-ACP methyl ester carboxylesterase
MNTNSIPALEGVEHRFIELGGGVTIHVADAGPADGPPVMLVHGYPQNWWEWHELIGPLAADGYRVLCPDLRGAGWSSAPRDHYYKTDMANDLAAVLDRLDVGAVRLVAHDWGGPVAIIMTLRHPEKVSGFFGLNTLGPWLTLDLAFVRDLWRLWYQMPMVIPVVGPRIIGDPKGRYLRMVSRWVGAGFLPPDFDLYVRRMGEPGHAVAGSRWYRTFQNRESIPWFRGEFADVRINVPVRWLHGMDDPVITPTLLRNYPDRFKDFQLETVDGVGHWIVEQRPELVLERLRAFLRETP